MLVLGKRHYSKNMSISTIFCTEKDSNACIFNSPGRILQCTASPNGTNPPGSPLGPVIDNPGEPGGPGGPGGPGTGMYLIVSSVDLEFAGPGGPGGP